MADLINNNNENEKSEKFFSQGSEISGDAGAVSDVFHDLYDIKSLKPVSNNATGISIGFGMFQKGPVKGLFSGAASFVGGAVGLTVGGSVGAGIGFTAAGIPGAYVGLGAGSAYGAYKGGTLAGKWADNLYDKNYAYIRNAEEGFAKSFDKNWATVQKGIGNTLNTLSSFFRGNILNKDLTPGDGVLYKDGVFYAKLEYTDKIKDSAADIAEQKLSAESFYDPRTEQVNYDVTQRVLSKDGTLASATNIEGGVAETDLAASSDPASTNMYFQTPNGEIVQKVLYSSINIGAQFLAGYLVSRMDQLLFGKEGAKK